MPGGVERKTYNIVQVTAEEGQALQPEFLIKDSFEYSNKEAGWGI